MKVYTKNEFDNAKYKDLLNIKCDNCSSIFTRSKHNILRRQWAGIKAAYCSKNCQTSGATYISESPCITCGKNTKSKFCNHSCSAKHTNANRRNKKTIVCDDCGTSQIVGLGKRILKCDECMKKAVTYTYEGRAYKRPPCKVCGTYNCDSGMCKSITHGALKTLKKFGFNIDCVGTDKLSSELSIVRSKITNELLTLSVFEVCYKYDVQPRSFYMLRKHLGIIHNTKHRVHSGFWYKTWENKDVFLRSMLELNEAKRLDNERIIYDVEKIKVPYINDKGNRAIYKPDFYLPDTNTIIEIKGQAYYDDNCKLKADATRKMGFNYIFKLNGKEVKI